jgi:hypothetical protein
MGEIKSTLDIVMERTRHLSMTEEEKDDLRKKELAGKVKGWIQRYADGQIDLNRLTPEIERERGENPRDIDGILRRELIERLEPDGDNRKTLELIERFSVLDTAPLKGVIADFQAQLTEKREERLREMGEKLKGRGITGSAVVPNLARDVDWDLFFRERLTEARERLGQLA